MKDRTTWINIGISAGLYLLWLAVTAVLAEIDAISDFCLLLSAPILIGGSAYMIYRSGKLMIFPLTASAVHFVMCAVAIISLSSDIDAMLNDPSASPGVVMTIFIALGSTVIYVAFILIGFISLLAVFGVTLLSGAVTRKILKKNSP